MKKTATFLIVGALALSLAACSSPKNGAEAGSSSAPSDAASSQATGQQTTYFGEISAIAGNEIDVKMIHQPELPELPAAGAQEGDAGEAVAMTPATVAADGAANGANSRTEVEYTGETKAFVIPAGLPVHDTSGNEVQLSALKKGTVIHLATDAAGTVTNVVAYA